MPEAAPFSGDYSDDDPFVAPDGEWLYFASARAGGPGQGDLYYSWNTSSGWAPAIPITALNTAGSDLMPRMDPESETLYYTSASMGKSAAIQSVQWQPLKTSLQNSASPRR